jgi:hypothetical protein
MQENSGKYSISPNSGRLRKKIKKESGKSSLFKRRLDNFSFNSKLSFVIVGLILISVIYVVLKKYEMSQYEKKTKEPFTGAWWVQKKK